MNASDHAFGRRWAFTRTLRSVGNCYNILANQCLAPLGLTTMQSDILLYLYQRSEDTVETGTLLQAFQVSPAALSGALKKLDAKGYIHYSAENTDNRRKQISLTVRGMELQSRLLHALTRVDRLMFEQIKATETRAFFELLQKMLQSMRECPEAGRF